MTSDTPIGGKQFPWVTHLLITLKHFFETISLQSVLFLRILSQDFSLNLFKSCLICVASSSFLSGELWFWAFSCWLELGCHSSFRMVILVSFQVDGPAGTMEYQQSSSTSRTIQSSCRGVVLGWEVAVAVLGGNKILEMLLKLKDSQSESRISVPSFGF